MHLLVYLKIAFTRTAGESQTLSARPRPLAPWAWIDFNSVITYCGTVSNTKRTHIMMGSGSPKDNSASRCFRLPTANPRRSRVRRSHRLSGTTMGRRGKRVANCELGPVSGNKNEWSPRWIYHIGKCSAAQRVLNIRLRRLLLLEMNGKLWEGGNEILRSAHRRNKKCAMHAIECVRLERSMWMWVVGMAFR